MHMESLEDDNLEEFKGGSLQINQEMNNLSNDSLNLTDNDSKENTLSNLISIPKRLTESLWSCRYNNNISKALTSNSDNSILTGSPADFFTFRNSVVEKSIKDCISELINLENDGEFLSAFLLTEITNWDAEKERLVILTNKVLFSIKYDFIALKQLEHIKIDLKLVDDITIGDLIYPSTSLVPRINNLANGISGVLKLTLLQANICENSTGLLSRDRRSRGIKITWKSPSTGFKLNLFSDENKTITLTSHPLFNYSESLNDNQKHQFSMDSFLRQLIEIVELVNSSSEHQCLIQHKDIMSSTYLGLGSLIYNRNSLGFFKVRGKFSF